jgi:hypothetical protein
MTSIKNYNLITYLKKVTKIYQTHNYSIKKIIIFWSINNVNYLIIEKLLLYTIWVRIRFIKLMPYNIKLIKVFRIGLLLEL